MRRERLKEELAEHAQTLEEFQSLGDLNKVRKYLKRASTQPQKLEGSQDRVSWESDQLFGNFARTIFSESQQALEKIEIVFVKHH